MRLPAKQFFVGSIPASDSMKERKCDCRGCVCHSQKDIRKVHYKSRVGGKGFDGYLSEECRRGRGDEVQLVDKPG